MRLIEWNPRRAVPECMPGLSLLSSEQVAAETPDETWYALDGRERTAGAMSLWWRQTAAYDGRRSGYIGHFASVDEQISNLLLQRALERLRAQGCELALGPIDGSTWRRYRLLTEHGSGAEFPLDICTPLRWCDEFRAAGFEMLETYCSVALGPQAALDIDLDAHADDVSANDIRIRAADPQAANRDLPAVWSLSMRCFRQNPFFTPIAEEDFLMLYQPLLDVLDPAFILLAEDEQGLCAFHFAFPYETPGGGRNVVSKTMAVHPRVRGTGLGGHLLRRVLARAASIGADDVIMAFMHDANLSARWARRHGRVVRRYGVFGKCLP